MSAAPRPRAAIVGRMTRYEVVATIDGAPRVLGYTARPSYAAFIRYARERADEILPFLTEDDRTSYSTARGLTLGPRVRIHLSGRTEREADSPR